MNLSFVPPAPVRLGDEAYHLLNELLEERFGLQFPDHRRAILETRLQSRLRALGAADGMEYYACLRSGGEREMCELAKAVTNNETWFFREREQMEALFTEGAGELGLAGRILSAGCSSGEEAWTLSFYAKDLAGRTSLATVQVDAFDIDLDRVTLAQTAECRGRSLRQMTPDQVARYLEPVGADRWRVREPFRRGVRFRHGNLVQGRLFDDVAGYDAVFCRNALIYFSRPAVRRAVERLAGLLRPGGLLFLGHSESIIGLHPKLRTERLGNCIAYRKVA